MWYLRIRLSFYIFSVEKNTTDPINMLRATIKVLKIGIPLLGLLHPRVRQS